MPSQPRRCCNRLGCPGTVGPEGCDVCDYGKPTGYGSPTRGSRHQRGYDAKWVRLRDHKLARHPLCEPCEAQGIETLATEVHHKTAFRGLRDPLRLAWDNLVSVCRECHDRLTRERRAKG